MQLKAVCHFAGRIASPFSTYLWLYVSYLGFEQAGAILGRSIPKVSSERRNTDHGAVDLCVEAPELIMNSILLEHEQPPIKLRLRR